MRKEAIFAMREQQKGKTAKQIRATTYIKADLNGPTGEMLPADILGVREWGFALWSWQSISAMTRLLT
jgi:hypothetical protein